MGSLVTTSFWAFNNGLKFNWISWRTGRKSRNCKAMLKMYFCMLGIHPRYLPIWMVNWILSSELCSPWPVHPPTVCHPQKSLQWFVQWKRINGFEIQCPKWTMLFELINSLKIWLKTSLNVPLEITFIMSESPTPLDLWPWKEMTWFWLLLEAASLTWPIFIGEFLIPSFKKFNITATKYFVVTQPPISFRKLRLIALLVLRSWQALKIRPSIAK